MSVKSIIRTSLATVALTASAFTATTTLGSSQAEAGRIVVRIGHVHRHAYYPRFHRPFYIAPILAASYVRPCHWLGVKAYNTGSPIWHARYQTCLTR